MTRKIVATLGIPVLIVAGAAEAHEITAKSDPTKPAAFDITRAGATTDGRPRS
jgi:hypothetical protein